MVAALAAGPTAFAESAQAQFYFRPFAYSYSYHRPMVEEPAPYGSYRSVARILAREGYRLVGPLGNRGDQVVATGVDADGRRVRFFIDPYEGQVLHSRPIASARAYQPSPELVDPPEDDSAGAPPAPRVIPGVSEEGPNAEPPARKADQRKNPAARLNVTPPSQNAAHPAGPQPAGSQPATVAAKPDPVMRQDPFMKPDSGSHRAVTAPRAATGAKPAAPATAAPTTDAKAPPQAAAPAAPAKPAAASTPQPAEAAAPGSGAAQAKAAVPAPSAIAPQPAAAQPAAPTAATAQGAPQSSPASTAQPASAAPAAAAPAIAAPAKPDAANESTPKTQSSAGG
jgi:hypothetical protein